MSHVLLWQRMPLQRCRISLCSRVLHKYCAFVLDSLAKYCHQVLSLKYPALQTRPRPLQRRLLPRRACTTTCAPRLSGGTSARLFAWHGKERRYGLDATSTSNLPAITRCSGSNDGTDTTFENLWDHQCFKSGA
jgi:hypothetical protein